MTFKKLAKMATILNKTFVLKMVGTIAVAITITDHSKTEPLEIWTSQCSVFQCIRYSNFRYSSPDCKLFLFLTWEHRRCFQQWQMAPLVLQFRRLFRRKFFGLQNRWSTGWACPKSGHCISGKLRLARVLLRSWEQFDRRTSTKLRQDVQTREPWKDKNVGHPKVNITKKSSFL